MMMALVRIIATTIKTTSYSWSHHLPVAFRSSTMDQMRARRPRESDPIEGQHSNCTLTACKL